MRIKTANDILTNKVIADKIEDIQLAERMATKSLEMWNELESLIDISFDAENREYDPNTLIAINDFKSIIRTCTKRIESEV